MINQCEELLKCGCRCMCESYDGKCECHGGVPIFDLESYTSKCTSITEHLFYKNINNQILENSNLTKNEINTLLKIYTKTCIGCEKRKLNKNWKDFYLSETKLIRLN